MNYKEEYKKWCEDQSFDEETREELLSIKDNEEEIKDRFYKELEFGTAGLRGVIGMGTNRMNKYTVGKATQGLANYIIEQGTQDKGVAISYDSRRKSDEFSLQTALILNANGIKTYLFESLRPVPELSFAVRELKCTAGVMITASHNPPKYNGYKVYWDDGAQIVAPRDKDIIAKVRAVAEYSEIKEISKEEAIEKGLFNIVGTEMFLLGIIGEGTGIGGQVLAELEITMRDARTVVENLIGFGNEYYDKEIIFTERAKRVLEKAWELAKKDNKEKIESAHMLLALTTEPNSLAMKALEQLGVDAVEIKEGVKKFQEA